MVKTLRGCPRCRTTYPSNVLYCSQDGSPTVEIPDPPPGQTVASPPRPASPAPTAGSAPTQAIVDTDLLMGHTVGNFKLVKRLGAGAMGSVYEGVHPLMGKRVAVKVLGGTLAIEQELVERFFSEARALNQIAHENIVTVIDLGTHPQGFYYCVMELLDGETLTSILRYGRIQPMRALFLAAQIADGLAAAHDKGIVHRDLKPANIMVVRHPQTGVEVVKIVDFGIAKLKTKAVDASATATGLIIGTPQYMSPEQAAGRASEVDGRSDLYSLGLVSYEMFTGRVPFEGRAIGELIAAQIGETPPPPSTIIPLPKRIDDLVGRLLKKKKEERFSSASSVARELRLAMHALRDGVPDGLPSSPPSSPGPVAISWDEASAATVPADRASVPAPVKAALSAPAFAPRSVPGPAAQAVVPAYRQIMESPETLSLEPPDPPSADAPAWTAPVEERQQEEEPDIPFEAPLPTPKLAPVSTPGRRPMSASRQPVVTKKRRASSGSWVRGGFLVALLAAGALFGLERLHLIDFSTYVGNASTTLGMGKPEVSLGNTAKLKSDGVVSAFEAAPALDECQTVLKSFRHAAVATGGGLEHSLNAKLADYNKFDECLAEHGKKLPPQKQWAASYLDGFAAYTMASDLANLPKESRRAARAIADEEGTHNFDPLLYVGRATDRFNDARPDATMVHRGVIDQYLADLDAMNQRARQETPPAK